ncbi:unnamed protein product [Cuscuta epithymum]|uniref:Uncharacterized protein n=1 Tax=Cuscuta epithymum TaxID=186058 RepID=A0AAV0D8I1_9ASTE|nr:unnamed protein product [Cuscuta epithymum]CAH9145409.1 unnamed protein product [Cuscuta epithymum]
MSNEQSTSRARPNYAPLTEAERNNENAAWVTPQMVESDQEVLDRIKLIVGGHFLGNWACYTDVDPKVRELWWNLFKAQHRWTEAQGAAVLRAYNKRVSTWLVPTFKRARKSGKKPGWASDEVWDSLVRHWSLDPKFAQKSAAGKKNRMSEKAMETQWHGGRKPQSKHRETMVGPEKKKVSILKVIKHCWTKGGDNSEAELPPRIAELETKYQAQVGKKRAELGLTHSDIELDSDADDEAMLEAAGVYKGRVPCMGAEGLRILHNRDGASSSRSRVEDPRIAQLQRELEEQREQGRRTRARLEAMEQQMNRFNAGYRPEMYIRHPETTPQVPHMGNMDYNSYQFQTPAAAEEEAAEAAAEEAAEAAAEEAAAEAAEEAGEETTEEAPDSKTPMSPKRII